jgi:hypothetical protein
MEEGPQERSVARKCFADGVALCGFLLFQVWGQFKASFGLFVRLRTILNGIGEGVAEG